MAHTWKTPPGAAYSHIMQMLEEHHILISGATGSGKSVLIHTLIYHILYKFPFGADGAKLILIDPKRVTLGKYKRLPHCTRYASEPETIRAAISEALALMERRYKKMQRKGTEKNDSDPHIYIIVDEFADLMTTDKKRIKPQILRLAQLGRAANVHLILATQRPTADIIDGAIKVNIDWRIALKVPTARDSQNIIGIAGAERLPRFGFGIVREPCGDCFKIPIPYTTPDEIAQRVKFWESQRTPAEIAAQELADILAALGALFARRKEKKKRK